MKNQLQMKAVITVRMKLRLDHQNLLFPGKENLSLNSQMKKRQRDLKIGKKCLKISYTYITKNWRYNDKLCCTFEKLKHLKSYLVIQSVIRNMMFYQMLQAH